MKIYRFTFQGHYPVGTMGILAVGDHEGAKEALDLAQKILARDEPSLPRNSIVVSPLGLLPGQGAVLLNGDY